MDKNIEEFVSYKNIGLIGYSKNEKKFGNMAYNELIKRGYNVFPVNPSADEINGVKCYNNINNLNWDLL